MNTALADLERAAESIAAVDFASLCSQQFRELVAAVQEHLHQITLVQARMLQHGERYARFAGTGQRSMAAWLSKEVGAAYGDTVAKLKLADALTQSRQLDEAVTSGEVSPATAAVLAPTIARPPAGADLADLVNLVKGVDPTSARAVVEEWTSQHREETPEEAESRRFAKRSLRFGDPTDGIITGTFALPTLMAREVHAALSHLAGKPTDDDGRTTEQRLADGLVQLCDAYSKGTVCGGRERPSLLITAPLDTLLQQGDEPGRTLFGDLVPAHLVRRYAATADLQCAVTDHAGSVVALSTTRRLATDSQWRALVARDGGCRFPGCHIPAHWCDVDHVIPWERGGPTTLDNLVLWCRFHHGLKHSPEVEILGDAHHLRWRWRDDTDVDCPPRPLLHRFALA